LIVAGTIQLVAAALVFLEAHGVDTDAAVRVLAGGLAGNRILDGKAIAMSRREFRPGFRAELHHKDLGIVTAAARQAGVAIPLGAVVAQLMGAPCARGHGSLDHSALLLLVDELAGRSREGALPRRTRRTRVAPARQAGHAHSSCRRFARLGETLPPLTTKAAALSGGQRQSVSIGRAVMWGSHIVVMDEPTAALGVEQTELVLSLIERLKSHDVGVILISHNMDHLLRVADRVAVMRRGQKVADVPLDGGSTAPTSSG
jgi:NADP-dependent 3-hydroxyisobutyrate dehydrogenase-like protein/ABC transporter family protein